MEYSIGFKIDNKDKNFVLHSIVLTPDNKTGIIDYEPNKNADKIKIKLNLDDDYNSYVKSELTILSVFIVDKNLKVYDIKYCDNYIAFKNKNISFKENEIEFENGIVVTIPNNNNNYRNPNIEQSIIYLENKYKFSSTSEAYSIMNVISELKKLKYSKDIK